MVAECGTCRWFDDLMSSNEVPDAYPPDTPEEEGIGYCTFNEHMHFCRYTDEACEEDYWEVSAYGR